MNIINERKHLHTYNYFYILYRTFTLILSICIFLDIELKSTRVYSRGCVDKVMPEMNSADMDKCYDGEKFEGIVDELLEGYDFTMEKSTVCVCDGSMENGCNDWKNKFLMKPVDDDDEHEENETMSTVTPPGTHM